MVILSFIRVICKIIHKYSSPNPFIRIIHYAMLKNIKEEKTNISKLNLLFMFGCDYKLPNFQIMKCSYNV